MHGVKSKVGPLCICCVVVWLVLVYGENWGQLAQSDTAPLLLPPWPGGILVLLAGFVLFSTVVFLGDLEIYFFVPVSRQ